MRSLPPALLLSWLAVAACNQDRSGIIPLEESLGSAPAATPGTLLEPGASSPPLPDSAPTPGDLATPPPTGGAACAGDGDCSALGQHCDSGSGRCVECAVDAHCEGGGICMVNRCAAKVEPEPSAGQGGEPATPAEPEPIAMGGDGADDDLDAGPTPASDAGPSAQPPTEIVPLGEGCSTTIFDPCSEGIPMLAESHSVDGDPSDFCELPVAVLDMSSAALTIGDTSGLPHRADIKVAWTADALHVFARVVDPNVLPEGLPNTWSGDSFEVYVASTAGTSGNLGDDGTPQIILAPPSLDGSLAASAISFPAQEEFSSGYAAATEDSGYVVELAYPWPGGASLAPGASIRLDFAINAREQECADPSDLNACRQYYGAFTAVSPGGSGPCDGYTLHSGQSAEPWCDNRTWCAVTLN